MNNNIINTMSKELNIKEKQIETVLTLLSEGNTIPFIARYRKEKTGNLDEEIIRKINEVYEYNLSLLKRKEDVIRLINEKGLLTDELKEKIINCTKLVEVEDLYRPFKEKKKTKATDAISNGLESLAKIIMSFPNNIDLDQTTNKYLNDKVKTKEEALTGAKYIIAEWISDNAYYRKWIRNFIYKTGEITTKIKKNANDETKTYEMYYDYKENIKDIKPHRILAINRGENEKILTVNLKANEEEIKKFLYQKILKGNNEELKNIVTDAINDSYKRLIYPSIEREIRTSLKEEGEEQAITVFMKNLESLLLTPPMKEKNVLGLDPAYRTGCKLAVVNSTSKVLDITVIYPHEPKNKWQEAKDKIKEIVNKYNIDIIAIGNGTASRESEKLVAETISEIKNKDLKYIIVSEAGASVYSASKEAINEFPNLHVEERSAVSIARRLQDPLNELVKIDSKSIGVGQYQHDVNEKKLNESLDFVVTKVVNNVGVDLNTASKFILKYISGLTKTAIDKIIKYREEKGRFNSREELKKNKLLNDKAYEQAIGFLRINNGTNSLDNTPIHPESYEHTLNLLKNNNLDISSIGTEELITKLNNINIEKYSKEHNIDIYTLEDIIKCLKQPNRDYRDDYPTPILKSNILKLEDLTKGMKLEGTVRNIVDFGVFIDIGIKNDGLAHISKLTNSYIKHPSDILNVGDIVTCYVDDIFLDKKKVSLTLLNPEENNN